MLSVASTVAGILVLVVLVREVFNQLFYPEGRATLARVTFRVARRLSRRLGRTAQVVAGPAALVLVLMSWVVLAVVGWALIVVPHVPDAFAYAPGVAELTPVVDAVYLSLVGISTLGYGDVVPNTAPLRIFWPLQAAMGFGLITAGLAWTLSTYPPLGRQRSLARMAGLVLADRRTDEATLSQLTELVTTATIDLKLAPATYYMLPSDPRESLALVVVPLWDLASDAMEGDGSSAGSVTASRLRRALDGLGAQVVDAHLVEDVDATGRARLEAYRRDCDPGRVLDEDLDDVAPSVLR